MNNLLKKIVLIGPESTGKSTLGKQLASHFNILYCPEYAREHLTANGMRYTYDDLHTIARGQTSLEDRFIASSIASNNKLLIIDTDMYVMKVWCEFVFNKCHPYILKQIIERSYDLYMLCDIDLPWTADPLREYPDRKNRELLFNMYKDILVNQSTPWVHIHGNENERLRLAIQSVSEEF